jgi:UDP-N-acetylglucosamine--N-acetylmuramyl-(pentapeptide) pyrophosphoryl-undecaprenol N-acetylglucosamine transferase
MTTYLLAGGGTAGHVNPLLAVADRIREREPAAVLLVLGTKEGLESRLVPDRGYELLTIERLPFPRRPNRAALSFPGRFRRAVARWMS